MKTTPFPKRTRLSLRRPPPSPAALTLSAGEYRYQMVVCLYGEEGRMPVIVEDTFTIR